MIPQTWSGRTYQFDSVLLKGGEKPDIIKMAEAEEVGEEEHEKNPYLWDEQLGVLKMWGVEALLKKSGSYL